MHILIKIFKYINTCTDDIYSIIYNSLYIVLVYISKVHIYICMVYIVYFKNNVLIISLM